MLRAIIFDMDGVLIDSEAIHFEANKKVLADMGKNLTYEYYKKFIGGTLSRMWEIMLEEGMVELDLTVEQLNKMSNDATAGLIEQNGGAYPAVEGACELVKALKEQGFKLAVASSSDYARIERTLQKLNIRQYFEAIVSGEELENPKPAPDVFIKAADMLDVTSSECIVIEDSGNGVKAAKAADMTCVGYINPNSGDQDLSKADYLVESFVSLDKGFFEMVHAHTVGEP